jgi:CarD family transcriptional regulator
MFHVGDLIIYSAHGVCQIDDICEKTFLGVNRTYYVLHPIEEPTLIISIPLDHESVQAFKIMEKDQAETIIQSFRLPGIDWIENNHQRANRYQDIVNRGNREEISKVVNTLLKKQHEAEQNQKKLGQIDLRLLTCIQKILFTELAISLDTPLDVVEDRVKSYIELQE